jgi:membrane protein
MLPVGSKNPFGWYCGTWTIRVSFGATLWNVTDPSTEPFSPSDCQTMRRFGTCSMIVGGMMRSVSGAVSEFFDQGGGYVVHPGGMMAPRNTRSPAGLKETWWLTIRRTVREFKDDALTDWAAALTYYGVLSIFPGLLVLVSILGLLGDRTTDEVQQTVTSVIPGQAGQVINSAIDQVQASGGVAGLVAIGGLVVAFWSASAYLGAFVRAANAIYDVREGRPVWKTLPIRLALTAVVGVMLVASAIIVVLTGRLAEGVGELMGLGSVAVTVWSIAKWPVLILLVSIMFAILYWAAPNARHGGIRWVSPGSIVAVVAWLVASGAFAVYVANFGSYNKTYGAIASVIVLLVWLWLTNIAILFGAELDAERERNRAIAAGHSADEEPDLELRDDRKDQG